MTIFSPLNIGNLSLANRIVMAPMTRCFSPFGVPGADVAAYYRRRAEGETGLIVTEGVGIDHPGALGEARPGQDAIPHMHGMAALAGWSNVLSEVHAAGGKIFPQLWHQGVMKAPGTGPAPDYPACSPSGTWGPEGRMSSLAPGQLASLRHPGPAMSESAIGDVIAAFARSAAAASAIGFDGIALHGAHGYLIDSFLWGETNLRSDRWGGDLARRSEFAAAVVKAVRAAIGPDLPIMFRFSQWKLQDFRARLAITPHELEAVLGPIADAGVTIFDASVRYFDRAEFDGSPLNLAGWAKKLTGKLSMTVGGVGLSKGLYDARKDGAADAADNMALLTRRFERGEFDLVGVGRSLLGDPHWARKARLGLAFEPFDETSLASLA